MSEKKSADENPLSWRQKLCNDTLDQTCISIRAECVSVSAGNSEKKAFFTRSDQAERLVCVVINMSM